MGERPGPRLCGLLACLAACCGLGGPAFGKHVPRHKSKPWDLKRSVPKQRPLHGRHTVLVIDGEATVPGTWEEAQAMVRWRGQLVESYVCLPPDAEEKAQWAIRLGIKPLAVARGRRDPNSLAMAMELGRAAEKGRVCALLGCKTDLAGLVRNARRGGVSVYALLARLHRPTALAFRRAGAEVLDVQETIDSVMRPRIKALLQPDGDATFASLLEQERPPDEAGQARLRALLHELGYTERAGDPAVPAVAKCFHANGMLPLEVWPGDLALEQGAEALLAAEELKGYEGGLAYVEPLALPAFFPRLRKSEFGTRECGLLVGAGGPFVLRSAADLADRVLRRLGYLEPGGSFREAALAFAEENKRKLESLDVELKENLDEASLRALLHGAFVSSRHDGQWFSLPDASAAARLFLNREDLLADVNGPRGEVEQALRGHARLHGLPDCETFQEQLQQFNSKCLLQL